MKCAAVIVSYNPDIELLVKNVDAIQKQVDRVLLFDNASKNVDIVEEAISAFERVILIRSHENVGIAKAINICIKSLDRCYSWILTLDQDSIVPDNLIREYLKYINIPDVKMISPVVKLSVGREIQLPSTSCHFELIKRCITSACFVNVEALYSVGGLDERMFIDWVDHDLCKHFEIKGFKMLQCNDVVLYHNLGSNKPVFISVLLNKWFKTKIVYQTYSPFRIYYMIRNSIYYMRKYKGYLDKKEKLDILKLIIQHVSIKSIITSERKIQVCKSICKGVIQGLSLPVDINIKYI